MQFIEITNSTLLDARPTMYPSALRGLCDGNLDCPQTTSSYFGFIIHGEFRCIQKSGHTQNLIKGMYFSFPGDFRLEGRGMAIIIERIGFRGMAQWGGPVEETGRLCYIDDCSTSILVNPPRMGDPVFNLLVFPPNTNQTMHIHPSVRLGAVYEGHGECVLPGQAPVPLTPGSAFYLTEGARHCFRSFGETMKIIAFHPDSDVGPTDSSHPMLSRTYTKTKS